MIAPVDANGKCLEWQTSVLTGEDRSVLYMLASQSGFRRNETASLTLRSFNVAGDTPSLSLAGKVAKNRETVQGQPLNVEAAKATQAWAASKGYGPDDVLFKIAEAKTAQMLHADLKRAGIEPKDADGKTFDLHALRTQYDTNLLMAGMPLWWCRS